LRATDFDVQGSVAMRMHFQSKYITIDEVLVNGSKNTMLHFVGNDKKTVSFYIKGTLLVDMNISVEVFLYDRNESLIAGYSPTDWDGSTHRLPMGKFEIQESFDLPETLTSGEYSIAVLLSQKNIEHLVRIEHLASISVEEFASPITGNVFWQSYIGSIVLHHDGK
jgi:hypothetical protein